MKQAGKLLVAVSGGVDSVVLLDILAKTSQNIIVAHFNHQIRNDSDEDLGFVRSLAAKYGLEFVSQNGNLGKNTSEDKARQARYYFLRRVAAENKAVITTGHHLDDLVETVAINLQRGTGWRGLAVLGADDVYRPLLKFTKRQIIDYAIENQLDWREDSTNLSDLYLRNRLRQKLTDFPVKNQQEIYKLWQSQMKLRDNIDQEVDQIIKNIQSNKDGKLTFSRYFFIQIPKITAVEILRKLIIDQTGQVPTRSQTRNLWLNIKTIQPGKKLQILSGQNIKFTKTSFSFE